MGNKFVVTGIGTDVGKTVVSSILAEALKANYWKPVQAGDLQRSDTIKVKEYTENVTVLEEGFRLTEPISPHAAAEIDGVSIELEALKIPEVSDGLVIEGAGGLLVPINLEGLTYADVFENWGLPVIVVSRHYLGSINHTLLTLEVLKERGIKVEGIVFVGSENSATERLILGRSGVKLIARIPIVSEVNKAFVLNQAALLSL
ncbi:MAG: dethiobiotin synthase [Crocinitomicaceae bacterium]|jgi:dethiobiotin synthetase|nr:dethiobiotin synthase [Crocinitomicaceae bacterium]MDA9169552.1 dethiobiotin synthase [Crocinitomicaceae bacterium]MDG1036999.1 dethiobiotin synthase [Crocinitomicaceae bacterium]MDG1741337.1 dethiobiotin synthase [Crocinitomicaceae bacterium]